MLKSLVKSLDYQRNLSQYSKLDYLVDDQVVQEHKMNDRDFMQLAQKGEEVLAQYLKILKLKVSVSLETKLLVEAVIKKHGYNSKAVTELLNLKVKNLDNPFDFSSFEKENTKFYIPQNTLDLFCATVLLINCTYSSSHRTKKGEQERIFILVNNKLEGIFTRYHNLKQPAWALTGKYSQSLYSPLIEAELMNREVIIQGQVRIKDSSQYFSLIPKTSVLLMSEMMQAGNQLSKLGLY